MMFARRALLCVALFAPSNCGGADGASGDLPSVVVSAAVSLSESLRRAADEFERTSDTAVVLNIGGSDTLATQILAGANVDLFVSADTRQMERVEAGGRILSATRVDLLTNQLVAVVHTDRVGEVSGPADLKRPEVGRIAMGDPDAVPAGVYAREFLQSAGLWDALRVKVVPTRNVRAALAAVEAGNADVGFVYRTDLASTGRVKTAFAVPLAAGPPIRYVAAVTADAPHPAAAHQLLTFLREGTAQRIFAEAGFIPLEGVSR